MPLLTLIAVDTPVRVEGLELIDATVARVNLRLGANPLWYTIVWTQGRARPRQAYRADEVSARDRDAVGVTVIAPGSSVKVEGMQLPGATIEAAELKPGPVPVEYAITWTVGGKARRGTWHQDAVSEIPGPIPGQQLGDLGRILAEQMGVKS